MIPLAIAALIATCICAGYLLGALTLHRHHRIAAQIAADTRRALVDGEAEAGMDDEVAS